MPLARNLLHVRAMRRRSRFLRRFLFAGAILGALRLLLPLYVERRVLAVFDDLEDFKLAFEDIDLALWRLAYEIEDARLYREG